MSRRHISLLVRTEALRLRREGRMGSRAIAARLGVDGTTVRRWLRAAGLAWPDGGVVGRSDISSRLEIVPCAEHEVTTEGRFQRCARCKKTLRLLPVEWTPSKPPAWAQQRVHDEAGADRYVSIRQPAWGHG